VGTESPGRHRQPWNILEVVLLISLCQEGAHIAGAAEILRRTTVSVSSKLYSVLSDELHNMPSTNERLEVRAVLEHARREMSYTRRWEILRDAVLALKTWKEKLNGTIDRVE
jgi:hypothetical protein